MAKFISDMPSALYRQQIRNIAGLMWRLTSETTLHPLRNMAAFNKVQKEFNEAKNEAYLCCAVMDTASIENEDRANNAATAVMAEMVHLQNNANDLIKNEPNETLQKRDS